MVLLSGGAPANITNSPEQETWMSIATIPFSGVAAGTRRR